MLTDGTKIVFSIVTSVGRVEAVPVKKKLIGKIMKSKHAGLVGWERMTPVSLNSKVF